MGLRRDVRAAWLTLVLSALATAGPWPGALDPVGAGEPSPSFRELAKRPGEPQLTGLKIIYLHPLGNPADANKWRYIIVHQTEGPPGSARSLALAQSKNPT
jgi:hypothetical protein